MSELPVLSPLAHAVIAAAPPLWYCTFWIGLFLAYCAFWKWGMRGMK